MLKVVVFDSGYGGEFFADHLSEELPVLNIIRVIDWRHADQYLRGPWRARRAANRALSSYFGKVDLIIFANHLLSITSLKYFKRKYPTQKFIGLELARPDTFIHYDTLILSTKAVARTPAYQAFRHSLKRRTKTLALDNWSTKIDDGDLTAHEIDATLKDFLTAKKFAPEEVILACSQFQEIEPELRHCLGHNLKIYDGFADAIRRASRTLGLRGGLGRKEK